MSQNIILKDKTGQDVLYQDVSSIKLLTDEGTTATFVPDIMEPIIEEEIIRHVDIPEYVKTEALRVANKVQSVRMDDSIVFLAMSDNHYYGAQKDTDTYTNNNGEEVHYSDPSGLQTNISNLHAAMAAKILAYSINIDFMAQLGDMTWGSNRTSPEILHTQITDLTNLLKESHKNIPCFHAIGNHDTGFYRHRYMNDAVTNPNPIPGVYTESGDYLFEVFTAHSDSDDTVFGGQDNGGYCYRDFTDKKLRVFLLNSCEGITVYQKEDKSILGSQLKWFADSLLNLNTKTDAVNWGFIVLSHYPADFAVSMPLSELLRAYVEGNSITISIEDDTNSTVNFASKNKAKFIAQFHGHIHNYVATKLSTTNNGTTTQYDAWRICIPNSQYDRENTYSDNNGIIFHEDMAYPKTPNSAEDTSFVVNVINPSESKIYSFCYGAGRDRTISYAKTVWYTIYKNLSNATISDTSDSVEEGKSFTAIIIPDKHCSISSVTVTMNGIYITSSCYSEGNINIPSVTGNIMINANAEIALGCTNQIPISTDTDGSFYNGCGYKDKSYIQANGSIGSSNYYVTGFIPIAIGDIIRFKNLAFANTEVNRIWFYTSDKTVIGQVQSSYLINRFEATLDSNNCWNDIIIDEVTENSGAAYMRLQVENISEASILTINEEIRYVDDCTITRNYSSPILGSNSNSYISIGDAYTLKLTPFAGYSINQLTVTMGGVDITSTAYSDNIINILEVTGDIVITATAIKDSSYENQIPFSTDTDESIYNGCGYKYNRYVSSSTEVTKCSNGILLTGFIPCAAKNTIYMKNVGFIKNSDTYGYQRITIYDSNKNYITQFNANNPYIPSNSNVESNGTWTSFTIGETTNSLSTSGKLFIRISANYIGPDSIITVNEPIK